MPVVRKNYLLAAVPCWWRMWQCQRLLWGRPGLKRQGIKQQQAAHVKQLSPRWQMELVGVISGYNNPSMDLVDLERVFCCGVCNWASIPGCIPTEEKAGCRPGCLCMTSRQSRSKHLIQYGLARNCELVPLSIIQLLFVTWGCKSICNLRAILPFAYVHMWCFQDVKC